MKTLIIAPTESIVFDTNLSGMSLSVFNTNQHELRGNDEEWVVQAKIISAGMGLQIFSWDLYNAPAGQSGEIAKQVYAQMMEFILNPDVGIIQVFEDGTIVSKTPTTETPNLSTTILSSTARSLIEVVKACILDSVERDYGNEFEINFNLKRKVDFHVHFDLKNQCFNELKTERKIVELKEKSGEWRVFVKPDDPRAIAQSQLPKEVQEQTLGFNPTTQDAVGSTATKPTVRRDLLTKIILNELVGTSKIQGFTNSELCDKANGDSNTYSIKEITSVTGRLLREGTIRQQEMNSRIHFYLAA